MNITCDITNGMRPNEKETYFNHMEMRHKEEQEAINEEKQRKLAYKHNLINDILEWTENRFTLESLMKKDIRTLERIYDNC